MLDHLRRRIQAHTPRDFTSTIRFQEAAVLLPITPRAELVLTLRASGLSTHSGEVAFPGGRRDPEDASLIYTALREAEEEIALPATEVEVIGPLSALISRHGVLVKPFVGFVPECIDYRPNDGEIAEVFKVPLEFFRDDPRETTHRIDYFGRDWYVPSYLYEGYKIWGLSAIMLVELINLLYDMRIDMHQPPKHFTHWAEDKP